MTDNIPGSWVRLTYNVSSDIMEVRREHIKSVRSKKLSDKNIVSSKTIFHKWKHTKDNPSYTKTGNLLVADLYYNKYQRKFFRLKVNDTI